MDWTKRSADGSFEHRVPLRPENGITPLAPSWRNSVYCVTGPR
jgi:hypothetical protein